MKALTPREIVEKIAQNKDIFQGASLTATMSSGHTYFGELVTISQTRDGYAAVLKSTQGRGGSSGDYQWLTLSHVESISLQLLTDEQLAILSDMDFDPLAGKPEPGKLALGRAVQDAEGRIQKVIDKQLKVVFADSLMASAGAERALQANVLQNIMALVVTIIEKHFTEDFAKDELKKAVDLIELRPSDSASVTIKGQTMEISCPWSDPKERWKESSLKDAINACF